ncbi:probable disease resistance RPP8-like protein 2 [Panicum virgatum]|uniref:probable disease resistance RPP8-like protein 2 n=1 Tax=Panicum virgatum TaxID=38727 RepID=UPI0019D51B92|nr:probable disease resistance RPP8-like protein 2 [Panicum virgatum]
MASAVGGLIASKLAELVWDEATLLWRFKDDVDGLKRTMVKLQALMRHADRREGQDEGERREIMRVWMKDFKAAAYDIEDLLDEFDAIELIKQDQPKAGRRSGRGAVACDIGMKRWRVSPEREKKATAFHGGMLRGSHHVWRL